MKWNPTRAQAEGWDLFDVDGRIQLQRIDDPAACPELGYDEPKFDSDVAAILHVAWQAQHCSNYHHNALSLIGQLTENLEG